MNEVRFSKKEKIDLFAHEINSIRNPRYKEFLINVIKDIPDYFFVVPAFIRKKNHSSYAFGEGGLFRYTRAKVAVAENLFKFNQYKFSNNEKDLIICSLILSDSRKYGEDYSCYIQMLNSRDLYNNIDAPEHASVAAISVCKKLWNYKILTQDEIKFVVRGILSHDREQWDIPNREKVKYPLSNDILDFINLCNYLPSKKDFNFSFRSKE